MKKISLYLSAFAIIVLMNACDKDENLDIGPFEYQEQEVDTTTALGKKIYEINEKYESKVIYNWDSHFIGNEASAYPPQVDKVYDFLVLMEEIWFKPYYSDAFLRKNLPREIVLVGGSINYGEDNGTSMSAAGQADSQYRINVGTVNDYSTDMASANYLTYRYTLTKVLHHEFAHILSRRYDLPKGYADISKGLYLKNTHYSSLGYAEALSRGFIRPYGATNELEDFATLSEVVVTRSEENVLHGLFSVLNEAGTGYDSVGVADYDKVYEKYKMLIQYYNNLGIDVQRIGNETEAWLNQYIEDNDL
ncbi:MAG: putative zinc-binding metallopeptidase [Draconibacterium sp.]